MPKTVIHPSAPNIDKDWATRRAFGSSICLSVCRLFERLRHSGRASTLLKGLRCGWAAFALLAPVAASAQAVPSQISMDGATLRLVAEAPAADAGEVRAALLVDLEPGWKTYWLDPGEAGIPLRLDLSTSENLRVAETAFPLPHRTHDPSGNSNVYAQPFAIALTLQRPAPDESARIDLGLTLGLCRDICIPAAARLSLDITGANAADARLVAYAFDSLPEPSTGAAGIQAARLADDGKTIEVEALAQSDRPTAQTDLFLAGPDGWFFGPPAAPERSGRRLVFRVPVTAHPKSAGTAPPSSVEAVLLLGAHAYRAELHPAVDPR